MGSWRSGPHHMPWLPQTSCDGAHERGRPRRGVMEFEEARKSAQRELDALKHHQERIEELKRDKEALLAYYEGVAPGALEALTPEERYRLYKLVRLQVRIHPGHGVEISWAGGEGSNVCENETVSASNFGSTSS